MKIACLYYGLLLVFLFSVPNVVVCASSNQSISVQKTVSPSKKNKITKKEKRQKSKKMQGLAPLTKGILAAVFGVVSIFAVIGSIAASFALSPAGVVAGIVVGLGAGFAAIFLGIKARRELKAAGEKGSIWAILGIVFGGIAGVALLVLSLGALFG